MLKKLKDIPDFVKKSWKEYFTQDTEKKKQKRIAKSKKDILYFARTYFPHYMRSKSAAFHKEILAAAKQCKRLAIAAPRGHAKSTILTLIFALWVILNRYKFFIIIVSDTLYQATLHLSAITNELENNDKLRKDFGNLIGEEKWTQAEILTTTGIRVMAKGTGSKLRGLRNYAIRPDLVICDDLENDEMVTTLEQRKKFSNWFNKSLSNVFGPEGGQIIVIGTIIHYDSLLNNILKKKAYKDLFYKAIKDNGQPLWPGVWTLEKLQEKKEEIGVLAFNSEYMNEPMDEETQIFKQPWIKLYKDEEIAGLHLNKYMALDPALSKKETADYSAFITIGQADNGEIFVLDADLCRVSPKESIAKLFYKYAFFKPNLIALETVAFQDVLRRWIGDVSTEKKVYLPVKEVKHTSDKIRRITRISPLFEQGIIHVKEEHKLLIEQLLGFPRAAHDDGPDALEMAIDIARQVIAYIDDYAEPIEEGEFVLEVA